jgi:hypothetical protein
MDNFLLCFGARSAFVLKLEADLSTAVGNQFTSLYRYGTSRDCSAKWEDFKFCMSNRNLSEEVKTEEWIRRRAEHWAQRRMDSSSEEIWSAKKLD